MKSTLQQIQAEVVESLFPAALRPDLIRDSLVATGGAGFGYRAPLAAALVAELERRAAPYRAPQYDQTLRDTFWKHVYNELPGTGPHTDRLQVITGTIQAPLALQVTGRSARPCWNRMAICTFSFNWMIPTFPPTKGWEFRRSRSSTRSRDPGRCKAGKGVRNPFDISHLGPGTRIHAAGPLIFDRAHGQPTPDGQNVESGLEIHPLVGMTVLSGGSPPALPIGQIRAASTLPMTKQLSEDLVSAVGQAETLGQTLEQPDRAYPTNEESGFDQTRAEKLLNGSTLVACPSFESEECGGI